MHNITDLEEVFMRENNDRTPEVSWDLWEVIYLWELLQWPRERTRFIPLENRNPAFTQKINNYRNRVQHGI